MNDLDRTGVARVTATPAACALIARLKARHGALLFYQSGGCCDNSAPLCLLPGELTLGQQDVCLGEISGCPFYISRAQYEYWRHTQLIIDVVPGVSGAFSLEEPEGLAFLTRSRLYTNEEWEWLNTLPDQVLSCAKR